MMLIFHLANNMLSFVLLKVTIGKLYDFKLLQIGQNGHADMDGFCREIDRVTKYYLCSVIMGIFRLNDIWIHHAADDLHHN